MTGASTTRTCTATAIGSAGPFWRRSYLAAVHVSPRSCREETVHKSEEEDFRDPSLMHDLPDRTPGEILYRAYGRPIGCPSAVVAWRMHQWTCDQPLGIASPA